jgi:PAS domain S-box-containing protein
MTIHGKLLRLLNVKSELISLVTDLSLDANILFASESIVDILGFYPDEVKGRSCFNYFHPNDKPLARQIHKHGVQLDRAAVLHYAMIKNRDGQWIGCEFVFTVVYDILVACISIYRVDEKSERTLFCLMLYS